MGQRRPIISIWGKQCLGVIASGVFFWSTAAAQAGDKDFEFLVRKFPETIARAQKAIQLRPNSTTTVVLYLKAAKRCSGMVTLEHVVENKPPVSLGQAKISVDEDQQKPLSFDLGPESATGGKEAPGLSITPPCKLRLELKGDNDEKAVSMLDVETAEPRGYVDAIASYEATTQRIDFTVGLKEGSRSLPCTVEVDLGHAIKKTKGDFRRELTEKDPQGALWAGNVPSNTDVYLNVDGYKRAFAFHVPDANKGQIDAKDYRGAVDVWLGLERYLKLETDKPSLGLPVELELDGDAPLSPSYRVRLGLNRTKDKDNAEAYTEKPALPGLRRQQLILKSAKAGMVGNQPLPALQFKTEVSDWSEKFDIRETRTAMWLRVIVEKKPSIGDFTAINVNLRPDSFAGVLGPKAVYADVTPDVPPTITDIRLVPRPEKPVQGRELQVTAFVKRDEGAPIDKVEFFLGKPPKGEPLEGKLDPKGFWTATLKAPKKDTLDIFATVRSKTGLEATKGVTFDLLSPAAAPPIKAVLHGSVLYGRTPQRNLRPDAVALLDAKGGVVKTTKTDKQGRFVFEDVDPGKYKIDVKIGYPRLGGARDVVVPPGVERVPTDPAQLIEVNVRTRVK